MKALVTGGAGFIGSHIVDLLLEKGHEVRIFDNLELPTHAAGVPDYLPKDADFVRGDMRNRDELRSALMGIDVVLHLAATGGFTPRIVDYMTSNSVGTANMLEIIRDENLPVRKIVVASSIAVYGEGRYTCPECGPVFPGLRRVRQMEEHRWEHECGKCGHALQSCLTDESTPVEPASPYAISKYDEERLVLMFGKQTGLPCVALRYFVTYGPRQSVHNPYTGICSIFSTRIRNSLPMIVYEDGLQTRDFVFVKDLARANVFALEDSRCDGDVYNVGTGRPTYIRDLAVAVREAWQGTSELEFPGRFRPSDVRHMVADPGRLADLGFRAETSLRDGLRAYVEWLASQGETPEYFAEAERNLQASGIVRG